MGEPQPHLHVFAPTTTGAASDGQLITEETVNITGSARAIHVPLRIHRLLGSRRGQSHVCPAVDLKVVWAMTWFGVLTRVGSIH